MVLIGHASINENGKAYGGKPGDQTGKEVCERLWYDKSWDYILRPKRMKIALESAKFCRKICANDHVGYTMDINDRNSLYFEMVRLGFDVDKLKKYVSTDCSAFMTCCAIAGGAKKLNYKNNAPNTRSMLDAFLKSGEYESFTDSKYLTNDKYLECGDILVSIGHHTVMALSDGDNVKPKFVKKIIFKGIVTAEKSLFIRKRPITGETIGHLLHGDIVYIYEIDPETGWYNIEEKGEAKWISNKYVEVTHEKENR